MCGRYALHAHPDVIALQFGLSAVPQFTPRYNIAPTAEVLIVRALDGARAAAQVRWGLVPRWAKDPSIGARLNNARAESIAQKPAFRDAYRSRRCLVPASGFYEWKAEAGRKQPYYVYPATGELFAFAGLWERWSGPEGSLETCVIVTTDANEKMRAVHDRMPVMVSPGDYALWLDCRPGFDPSALLRPCAPEEIAVRRVSRAVNNARSDSERLIEAVEG